MKMRIIMVSVWVFLSIGIALAHASSPMGPSELAQPINLAGVSNLYKVSDNLYRSAQPTADGLRNLKAMGIRTVINTRDFHSNREEVLAAGLQYERIHMKAWFPLEEDAVRFLKIVTDPKRTPVLTHCWLSSDRSGTLMAIYRIAVQGWSREDAVQEMTEGDFGFHQELIDLPMWVKMVNIERIKRKAGLESINPEMNQGQQKK